MKITQYKPMSNFAFRIMSLEFNIRDRFLPPSEIVNEAGIKPGSSVLDFGCGPGSYCVAAAKLAGPNGKVYALDMHPLAVKRVQAVAKKRGLANIRTILSDRDTSLDDETIDLVLLYDILHMLADPGAVLGEISRVLRPTGLLSVSDHHMTEENIASAVTRAGLFRQSSKGEKTLGFIKNKRQ